VFLLARIPIIYSFSFLPFICRGARRSWKFNTVEIEERGEKDENLHSRHTHTKTSPSNFISRRIDFYTILKAPVSTVVPRHLFINKPSQLFQINPSHGYRWPNGGPAWARRPRATTLAHARHAGLLTVPGQPFSSSDHLINST
jgi:hypothetical protein